MAQRQIKDPEAGDVSALSCCSSQKLTAVVLPTLSLLLAPSPSLCSSLFPFLSRSPCHSYLLSFGAKSEVVSSPRNLHPPCGLSGHLCVLLAVVMGKVSRKGGRQLRGGAGLGFVPSTASRLPDALATLCSACQPTGNQLFAQRTMAPF